MGEKELAGWFGKLGLFTQSPLDYQRISKISVEPPIEGGDITVTRRVTEMSETLTEMLDHLNWDTDVIDNIDMAEMATELMGDIHKEGTQTDLEKLLAKKELTVAETLDLYKRGLKPYFVSVKENMLVELTMENENCRTNNRIPNPIKWLHPKIAEKIQARYQEINDLGKKRDAANREFDSQIGDLKLRISMIEESGTDLII